MNETSRLALTRCRTNFIRRLSVHDIIDDMRFNDNFTLNEVEQILSSQMTPEEQAEKLLNILERKNQSTFDFFLEKLREQQPYQDLIEAYENELTKPPEKQLPEVNRILRKAGVPSKPNSYVHRTDLINETRANLKQLAASETGRLLLTGMGGQGKTVMIAESLRDPEIVHLFEGGLLWISVGKENNLFDICRIIAKFLECFDPDSTTLDLVQQDIRKQIANIPPALIVLDDVWNMSTTKAFDFLTHAVITSRNSAIMDAFRGDKFKVNIESGFSKKESVSVLIGDKNGDRCKEAEQLHENCNGWPFLISIIAAHLLERPEHLENYSRCVSKGKLTNITTSGSDYPYENPEQVIAISYDDLDETLQSLLQYFRIFDGDEYISVQTLTVILGQSKEELEMNLDRLIKKSMVTKKRSADQVEEYGIHYILHHFMKSRTHCKDLSRSVVEQCQAKYTDDGKWSTCKIQDSTIWWYLTKFMREAELEDMLKDFFTDLRSLELAIKHTDIYHVLREYESIKVYFEKWNETKVWEAFHSFFHRNTATIIRIMNDPECVLCSDGNEADIQKEFKDIVQVALFSESKDSPVYEAARNLAGHERYWITSCAQVSSETVLQITGVWDFCPSPDGNMIAVCKKEGDIALHVARTGEVLLLIKTPVQQYRVRFDRSGERLVSAGYGTITVWLLPQNIGGLAKKRRKDSDNHFVITHDWELDLKLGRFVLISAVSFSPDNTEVQVVSDNGDLLRCSLSDHSIKRSSLGHGEVKWPGAIFSDDDKTLAVVHEHSTVVYDTLRDRELVSFPEITDFRGCALFPSGDAESRIVFWESNTVQIWDIKKNSIIHEFQLEKEVWCVTVSRCKLVLAAATKSKKAYLYSLEDFRLLNTIKVDEKRGIHEMELMCNGNDGVACSFAHDHILLTCEYPRLSMRKFHSEDSQDEGVQGTLKPRNCWTLENGRSITLSYNHEDQLEVRIFKNGEQCQVKHLPGLFKLTNEESLSASHNKLGSILRHCCLNSEGTLLAVSIKHAVHSLAINWTEEQVVYEITHENKRQTENDVLLMRFINEQGDRLLVIDCQGSIKIQETSHSHELREIGQLETTELVNVLYLSKRRSLLVQYKEKICLLPLENTTTSPNENVVFIPDRWILYVSMNSEERYVAAAYGYARDCVVKDLDSSQQVQISDVDAIAFHPVEPNILFVAWGREIRFYLMNQKAMNATLIGSIIVPFHFIQKLSWSPDGKCLAVRCVNGIHLLSVQLHKGIKPVVQVAILWTVHGKSYTDVFDVPFSMSNSTVIAVHFDENVHVVSKLRDERRDE